MVKKNSFASDFITSAILGFSGVSAWTADRGRNEEQAVSITAANRRREATRFMVYPPAFLIVVLRLFQEIIQTQTFALGEYASI
ncbi:hypothetical protein [Pseudomonas aeruginosa]|uniref:hypothetical protein n=1 Tax=Pseudomonas aeruginosa TaxID=287 RepID=UPI001CD9A267|nr:hypothetical protein [Pseudomonas aeruginosa]MCC0283311.1 hypothetical protein [Pseudomonas aeruginosa]MDD1814394.1 hypothetical protein [Pseudomonas aeruginosa]MDQ6231036.1 hypothetical protein [Pseudomonas aeruginosa]MDV7925246.1 hypothetical protein [Pseudomonas aeruginosa]MDY1257017.1 hypothetical protein [Pseudomonas aeruginosa]